LDADGSVDDLAEISVNETYNEYKKKLEDASPDNQDHIIRILGVMNHLGAKSDGKKPEKKLGEEKSSGSESDESKSVESRQQFKQVSGKTPLRMCPNFKTCKYCLCHNCYTIVVQKERETTKLPASPDNQRKNLRNEVSPPSAGRRKRCRGKEDTVMCDHEQLSMLVMEENVAYFRKAYVTKKGADYDYPKKCSRCQTSLMVEV
jgi:hypothetical protein